MREYTVRLPDGLASWVDSEAGDPERSKAAVVRDCVRAVADGSGPYAGETGGEGDGEGETVREIQRRVERLESVVFAGGNDGGERPEGGGGGEGRGGDRADRGETGEWLAREVAATEAADATLTESREASIVEAFGRLADAGEAKTDDVVAWASLDLADSTARKVLADVGRKVSGVEPPAGRGKRTWRWVGSGEGGE